MADVYGPFDGTPWSQAQWYTVAKNWAPSGINGAAASTVTSGAFAVTASGLSLTVGAAGFSAWVRGAGYQPDTNKVLSVTANANASLSRRDRLVIRRDLSAKTITVERLQGTAASTPVALTPAQSDTGTWEIPICSFLVPPNNGTTLSGFVDERGWIDPSDTFPSFFTAAARDANITAPTTGQVCRVGGQLQVYAGGWGSLINNAGTSGVLAGSAPPSGTPLTTKTFYASVVHNGLGDGTVIFPVGAFPNGLTAVNVIHYSAGTAPSNDLEFVPWGATLSSVNTRCYGPTGAVFGGTGIALICTAIGW